MQTNLAFTIPIVTKENSAFPKPANGNYEYWGHLVHHFLKRSDAIEIHCWNEEVDMIEEIANLQKGSLDMTMEEKTTIFKGEKTDSLSEYVLVTYLNQLGDFKWFQVDFFEGNSLLFHSGHWGTEFYVPNVAFDDICLIKSVVPVETNYIQY